MLESPNNTAGISGPPASLQERKHQPQAGHKRVTRESLPLFFRQSEMPLRGRTEDGGLAGCSPDSIGCTVNNPDDFDQRLHASQVGDAAAATTATQTSSPAIASLNPQALVGILVIIGLVLTLALAATAIICGCRSGGPLFFHRRCGFPTRRARRNHGEQAHAKVPSFKGAGDSQTIVPSSSPRSTKFDADHDGDGDCSIHVCNFKTVAGRRRSDLR